MPNYFQKKPDASKKSEELQTVIGDMNTDHLRAAVDPDFAREKGIDPSDVAPPIPTAMSRSDYEEAIKNELNSRE